MEYFGKDVENIIRSYLHIPNCMKDIPNVRILRTNFTVGHFFEDKRMFARILRSGELLDRFGSCTREPFDIHYSIWEGDWPE